MTSESNGTTKVWNWDDWPDIKPRSRRAADDTQTREEISGELKQPQIAVEIRKSGKPGATKAYADIRLDFPDGEIHILGFGIIKQPGKSPWVAFPQNHGENKYFPVVLAKGRIHTAIVKVKRIIPAHEKRYGSGGPPQCSLSQ